MPAMCSGLSMSKTRMLSPKRFYSWARASPPLEVGRGEVRADSRQIVRFERPRRTAVPRFVAAAKAQRIGAYVCS